MQNLALSSQFSNSGRRGNSSSNSFQSIVLNGVLPPSEDGRVEANEGIKAPPKNSKGKKVIDNSSKPFGYGFPDDKPGDFASERKWAQGQDDKARQDNSNPSGTYILPPNTYVNPRSLGDILLEELERKRNTPETEEEKKAREYLNFQIENLRRLLGLYSLLEAYNNGINTFNNWFALQWPDHQKKNSDYNELNETIFYLIEGFLNDDGFIDMAYEFLKYREQNQDKKKSVKFFQEFIPPKKVLIGGNETMKVDVHKIEMEMILSFIDGVAYLTIIMTIWYGSISKSEVILHKPLE